MSNFTTEVRYLCETAAGLTESEGFSAIDTILNTAAPRIFNFDYPIFDENYRIPLEKKILRHFYTREICEETVGLWKLRLWDKLSIVMPYFNQLYESALIKVEPFIGVDYTRSGNNTGQTTGRETGTTTGNANTSNSRAIKTNDNSSKTANNSRNSNENGNNSGTSWNLYSDTPQGSIQHIDVTNNEYLTNATKDTSNNNFQTSTQGTESTNERGNRDVLSNESGSATSRNSEERTNDSITNNTSQYVERIVGMMQGKSQSELIKEFRETFLNIDAMVIKELEPLFFHLWE